MDLLLQSFHADVRTIGGVLVAAPDAPIVHCPGWSVAELVAHHGEVHRWATGIVLHGEPAGEDFPAPDDLVVRSA
jgi:hypothetical protein